MPRYSIWHAFYGQRKWNQPPLSPDGIVSAIVKNWTLEPPVSGVRGRGVVTTRSHNGEDHLEPAYGIVRVRGEQPQDEGRGRQASAAPRAGTRGRVGGIAR